MSDSLDRAMAEPESMATQSWQTCSSRDDITPASMASCDSAKTLRRTESPMSVEEAYLRPSLRNVQKDRPKPDLRSDLRKKLTAILDNRFFHMVVVTVISCNVVVILAETNASAKCIQEQRNCSSVGPWPQINRGILFFYTIELAVRLYVSRREFFFNVANVIDAMIVFLGCIDVFMVQTMVEAEKIPEVGFLRVFRLLRVFRFSRLLSVFPELLHMARGFFQAMAAMFWGFGLLVVMLMMFAVITVELVYPVAQTMADRGDDFVECAERLSRVQTAVMFFFQTLVAGDSWGLCSIPLIREEPFVFLVLGFALVCIQLGLTNLILSAIIESAYKHHAIDERAERLKKFAEEKENVKRILDIMSQMDTDKDGGISITELETGYEEIHELRRLFHSMELDAKDLHFVFHMMDTNGDGMCSYAEFIETIRKSHEQDVKTQLMFVKLQLSQIAMRLQHNLSNEMQTGFRSWHESPIHPPKRGDSSLERNEHLSRGSKGPGDAEKEDGTQSRSSNESCLDALAAATSPSSGPPAGGDGSGENHVTARSRWSDRPCYMDADDRPARGRVPEEFELSAYVEVAKELKLAAFVGAEAQLASRVLPTEVEASNAGEKPPALEVDHQDRHYWDYGSPLRNTTGVNMDSTAMPGRPQRTGTATQVRLTQVRRKAAAHPGGRFAGPFGDGTGPERRPSVTARSSVSV